MGQGEGGGVVMLGGEERGEAEVEVGVEVGGDVLLLQQQLNAGELRAQLNSKINITTKVEWGECNDPKRAEYI